MTDIHEHQVPASAEAVEVWEEFRDGKTVWVCNFWDGGNVITPPLDFGTDSDDSFEDALFTTFGLHRTQIGPFDGTGEAWIAPLTITKEAT